jgi:hypothetical protein
MAHQDGPTPEQMQAFMTQQYQQIQALQEQQQTAREEHQAQTQALQAALAATNLELQALRQPIPAEAPMGTLQTPTPTSAPKTVRTKAILPSPPKFNGTRSEYEGWRSLIKNKIDIDGEVIGSARNQFIYVASCLEGKGLQMALTFITANSDATDASATRLLDYLDSIFGDRHKAQRATETLRTMKQGPTELFSAFLPRFEKALADAGGMAWPDEAKRAFLDGALTFELRRLTISMPVIATYGAYVNEILRVSDLHRSTMRHVPRERLMTHQGASESMDWEPTRAAVAAPSQGGQKTRRARWVDQEEMDKRRQERRCFRCGASGHQIGRCPYLDPHRPTEVRPARGPRAAPGKSTLVEPQLESEGSGSEDNSRAEELN